MIATCKVPNASPSRYPSTASNHNDSYRYTCSTCSKNSIYYYPGKNNYNPGSTKTSPNFPVFLPVLPSVTNVSPDPVKLAPTPQIVPPVTDDPPDPTDFTPNPPATSPAPDVHNKFELPATYQHLSSFSTHTWSPFSPAITSPSSRSNYNVSHS
eukprot:scaffold2800_cov283-Chaetoceros_neogracile.AAC.5